MGSPLIAPSCFSAPLRGQAVGVGGRSPAISLKVAKVEGYPTPPETDSDFLAGFLDAEGSFTIQKQRSGAFGCACSVVLRRDDRELLAQLHESFHLGTLTEVPARRTSKPQVCWTILRKADCARLVELLRDHPLRGRKSLDYPLHLAPKPQGSHRR